jgi:hypothetical protein
MVTMLIVRGGARPAGPAGAGLRGPAERPGAAEQQAAGAMPPRADERRQAGDEACRVAPATHPLHAVVQADGGRAQSAIVARQRNDLLHRDAADLRRALRRPLQRALAKRLPAQRVGGEVIGVQPVVAHQLMHQCQRQRTVGARAQGDVFVALVGRFGAARVDADDARAVSLGLLHLAPEMQVAGNRVAAPDQDQLRLGKELHFHADLAAKRLQQRLAAGSGANGAIQLRRTQPVEEARCHALALHQSHGAGIAVGQYRFGLARGNGVEARGNVVQRFVPADRLETARSPWDRRA